MNEQEFRAILRMLCNKIDNVEKKTFLEKKSLF